MKAHHSNMWVSEEGLDELVKQNYGLLVSQALKFNPKTKHEFEDYIQIASISFIKAVRTHNPEKGKLSTHACTIIRNDLSNHIRNSKNYIYTQQLNDKDAYYISKEELWEYLPSSLTEEEYKVILMRINGHTRKEIATELSCSENHVKYITRKAFLKVKDANEKKNINGK